VRWFVSVAGVDFKQKNEIGVWPGFLLRLVCIFVDVLFLVASGFLEDLKLKCMWHQTCETSGEIYAPRAQGWQ
jgi:hypothetical protein